MMCWGGLNDEIAISLAKSAKSLQGIYHQLKKFKLSNSASYMKILMSAMPYFACEIYYA